MFPIVYAEFRSTVEKWFMILLEFKAQIQRLYHHPNNYNNRLWKDFLTSSNLVVARELMSRVSNKSRTFLYLHEILQSVKPFSAH